VGDQPPVTERFRGPPRGAVEHAVDVRGAVGAGPVHLKGVPVVVVADNPAADGGHAGELAITIDTQAELHPARRPMVAVVSGNERAGLPERDWDNDEPAHWPRSRLAGTVAALTSLDTE